VSESVGQNHAVDGRAPKHFPYRVLCLFRIQPCFFNKHQLGVTTVL
jgi:hypothetical protein